MNIIRKYFLLAFAPLAFTKANAQTAFDKGINKVKHVVVIYMENHSFDNLYGQFPGADGIDNASEENLTQLDKDGRVYTNLPQLNGGYIPANLPNGLFNIDQYIHSDKETPDVTHEYYREQMQINGGKMNKFAAYNGSAGLAMGYYKTDMLPLYEIAKQYTLCDHFFHSAFGCSYLNHQWLIAAATPINHHAPETVIAKVGPDGKMIKGGAVTPDGYVVNTAFSINTPLPPRSYWGNDSAKLVPYQTYENIGDRLSEKNVSWAWFSGGWDDAMAGHPDINFQYHHQPFIYFAKYAEGTRAKKEHLKDEKDFLAAAKDGNLPAVSFVKPLGADNEHPGYSNVMRGEKHAVELINAVLNGPNGKDAVIILTYDENGGFWDHVAPPVIDKFGPGSRIPAIIISPFAKKGYVDSTQYETVSILAFIEKRWGLAPLNSRDEKAQPLQNAFQF